MKRFTAFILIALLSAMTLAGCGKTTAPAQEDKGDITTEKPAETAAEETTPADTTQPANAKLRVVATIFPQYDWVRQIAGDLANNMDLTLLMNNGVDLHSYQPSAEDMIKISSCDLFIYVGGESDAWVPDALKKSTNPNMKVINLMEILDTQVKTEDIVEGMEEEEGEEEEGEAYDEHVWLSLKNAQTLCTAISESLSSLDAANGETYKSNLSAYNEKLAALDSQYETALSAAPVKTLLFGDRFPFRYLVDDYGLSYFAAFPGCSAETEASFETIVFLAQKTDELKLKSIMVTENSNQTIAKTIKDNTSQKDQQVLTLNAIQSVSSENVENGDTYLSIMEDNLNVLKEALK